MKRNCFLTILLFLCVISCDEASVSNVEPLSVAEALSILTTSDYAQMTSEIGFEKSDYGTQMDVDDNKQKLLAKATYIGKHDHSGGKISEINNHYLLAVFDNDNTLQGVSTLSSAEDIQNIETSKFSGRTILQLLHSEDTQEVFRAEFIFADGALVELDLLQEHEGIREVYHNPVMECTGAKFDTEFDLEEATCYMSFALCFAARWGDCMIDEYF